MQYVASYVPLLRETEIICWDPSSQRKPTVQKTNAIHLTKTLLKAGDTLWLMIGGINAAIALAAFRNDVKVYQISRSRLLSLFKNNQLKEAQSNNGSDQKFRIMPKHVFQAVYQAPELFYEMSEVQAEVLEISTAWQAVAEAIKTRMAAINLIRTRLVQESIVYGTLQGEQLPPNPEEAEETIKCVFSDLFATKNEQGRKRILVDPYIAFLLAQENDARLRLERVCRNSSFFNYLFRDIEGIGPILGAMFITAIERIERFDRPKDLTNYGGLLPRGNEGCLPSRKRSRGQTLSRSPRLNHACFLLQNYMCTWGKKTWLGQLISKQVERDCPCTAKQRKENKELRLRHSKAVKEARIAMSRYFLEKIVWPRWRAYLGLSS